MRNAYHSRIGQLTFLLFSVLQRQRGSGKDDISFTLLHKLSLDKYGLNTAVKPLEYQV